jgi:hypothetical protein
MTSAALEVDLLGIFRGIPYERYAQQPAVNFSTLKEMARSPRHYKHRLAHPKESDALTLGISAHTAILEPARFMSEYVLWDERTEAGAARPRRGKDWDAFVAANPRKTIIKADEFNLAMAMRDAVRSNADAMRYLRAGEAETTILWPDPELNFLCKGRIDWLAKDDGLDVLVGIKTSRDCRPIGFGNQAARFGYHLQWAMYYDGWAKLTGNDAKVIEIVVESSPPHDSAVYIVPSEIIEQGRDEYRKLLERLAECEASGEWPGASEGEQLLSLPSWVYHAEDDISDLGLEA